MPIDKHDVYVAIKQRHDKQTRGLVPTGELASRRAWSSAARTCQNESAELHAYSMQMEHAIQNKKRANKGQVHHGLARRLTTVLTTGSTATRAAPANTPATTARRRIHRDGNAWEGKQGGPYSENRSCNLQSTERKTNN